jgi:hypothetical protein
MEWIKNNKEKVTDVQLSTVNERMAMGNKLYVSAWIFEIVAATIGLYVAWTTGNNISALEGSEILTREQEAQVILGSLPFVMVALAEVLKVPIVYLVYINRNFITKFFFSVVLFGLTFITFETLASAFENQFTSIIQKVQGPQGDIHHKTENILTLKSRIKSAETKTLESLNIEYNNNISSLNDTYQKTIGNLVSQRDTIEKTSASASNDRINKITTKVASLKSERDSKIAKLEKNYNKAKEIRDDKSKSDVDNRGREIQFIDNEIRKFNIIINKHDDNKSKATGLSSFSLDWCKNDKNCKSNYIQIEKLNSDKQAILSKSLEKNNESLYFSEYKKEMQKIEDFYQKKIDPLEEKISSIEDVILSQNENNLQIKNIAQDEESARNKLEESIKQADKDHKSAIKLLDINKGKVEGWRGQIESAEKEIETLGEDIKEHEGFIQVYRFTKYRMGVETVSEVTLDDVTTTAFWWYGSLAALVSMMGVVLAFGALILKHPKEKYQELKKEKRHRLKNTIRRMFISLRKRIREPKIVTKIRIKEVPKEVIKEVPVQKVVLTEVPVEVIKKEVFYEPLYTKDPDLLKFGTAKVRDILNKFGKGKDKIVKKDDKDS